MLTEIESRAPTLSSRALPAWPFAALFLAYPLWWVLGLSAFLIPAVGLICAFLMAARGWIRLPASWLWWVAFLGWMLASAVAIDTGARMIGFAQRFAGVLGALLIVVYVFNAVEALPRRRALTLISMFMAWLAVGGYLGMFLPYGRIHTLALALAPQKLANNSYVVELISPRFAEVQHPYGAAAPFVRPAAPFPYTNAWGHTFVLLIPVLAALAVRATTRTRWVLAALAALAVPPALATLNRGIAIGLAVALIYWAIRFRSHISLARIGQLALSAAAIGVILLGSGALNQVTERTSTSSTTQDRASLYWETFHRTLNSPWLGYGAPRPSESLPVSVGTQGHLWYLMFAHGFIGLALFLGAVWSLAFLTRKARGAEEIFMHTPIVVMLFTLLFYGVDPLHLVIALSCAVLLLREEHFPDPMNPLPAQPRRAG